LLETLLCICLAEFGNAFKLVLGDEGEIKGIQAKQLADPAKAWVMSVNTVAIPNMARVFFANLDLMVISNLLLSLKCFL
jgi:hypothetical protein